MGDLISRKALLAKVVEANPMGGMIGGKFIEDLIKTEPTAYDVDKVVEQLEDTCCKDIDGMELPIIDYDITLEIVKGAVKDE